MIGGKEKVQMQLNKEQYRELYSSVMPRSKIGRDCAMAFLVGGLICMLGQGFTKLYSSIEGVDGDAAALLTSLSLIALSALFTGFGIYDRIARRAGAGTLVPITGFANSVVAPALEFKSEGFILGTGAKMFIIAGPVIVYGTAASIIAGIITLLAG
jgi:stage V sporulation protein AC